VAFPNSDFCVHTLPTTHPLAIPPPSPSSGYPHTSPTASPRIPTFSYAYHASHVFSMSPARREHVPRTRRPLPISIRTCPASDRDDALNICPSTSSTSCIAFALPLLLCVYIYMPRPLLRFLPSLRSRTIDRVCSSSSVDRCLFATIVSVVIVHTPHNRLVSDSSPAPVPSSLSLCDCLWVHIFDTSIVACLSDIVLRRVPACALCSRARSLAVLPLFFVSILPPEIRRL